MFRDNERDEAEECNSLKASLHHVPESVHTLLGCAGPISVLYPTYTQLPSVDA